MGFVGLEMTDQVPFNLSPDPRNLLLGLLNAVLSKESNPRGHGFFDSLIIYRLGYRQE
jgi:hypothetical protein